MAKEKDVVVKQFIGRPEIFCDLYNGGLFGGEITFTPDMLSELSGESSIHLVDKNGKKHTVYRYRDVVKKVSRDTWLAVLACENQSEIHYGMAVRNLLYDALSYSAQMQKLAVEHKKKKDLKTSGEFLSGLVCTDKLIPVLTVVFYYGKEPWEDNTSLHDMLAISENMAKIKQYLPDYKLNLIHWRNVKAENFKTDLRKIFAILPFAGDMNRMRDFVEKNRTDYESLESRTYEMLLALLDEKRFLERSPVKEGDVENMCKAFDDMRAEGWEAGKTEGKAEAHKEVVLNMIAEGIPLDLIVKILKLPPDLVKCWTIETN